MKDVFDVISRRRFLRTASTTTLAGAALTMSSCTTSCFECPGAPFIKGGSRILFQGDSITDGGRDRKRNQANDRKAVGGGFVSIIMAELLARCPEQSLRMYNRGISGNKVFQLAERWQADCIELRPDLLSILIGVKDFWHTKKHDYQGTSESTYHDYRELLGRAREALPDCRLIICEPFMLSCGAVEAGWLDEFAPYRQAAKQLAAELKVKFIPFQSVFDGACEQAPAEYWAADGVHPTPAGCALMAKTWIDAVQG
jgi:lysophospholipase L1-like esterase